jgi:ribosomal protein S18 acetylase RimI-like enzyme
VISCIATTADARRRGHALRLVRAVCDDLAGRGFAAVEAYPELGVAEDATSAATPAFWIGAGFTTAVDDERFPVMRREL